MALLLVPTMHGGDSRVFLWGQSNESTPVHIFSGHSEAVLELQWLGSERLATWSKDRTLRLWGISKQLRSSLGGGDLSAMEEQLSTGLEESALHVPIEMSLEESLDTSSLLSLGAKVGSTDPSASLPILKLPAASSDGHSPGASHGSPSTHSLSSSRSVSSLHQQEAGQSLSSVSPVFQSMGSVSLAQEFSQLNVENVEIERVRSGGKSLFNSS